MQKVIKYITKGGDIREVYIYHDSEKGLFRFLLDDKWYGENGNLPYCVLAVFSLVLKYTFNNPSFLVDLTESMKLQESEK